MQLSKKHKFIAVLLFLTLAYFGVRWVIWNIMQVPSVTGLAFSPDGKTLAGAGSWHPPHEGPLEGMSVVRLWDVGTGKTKYRFGNLPHADWVAFSPDGKSAACGDVQFRCSIWNVQTGQQEQSNILIPPQISRPRRFPSGNFRWFTNSNELKRAKLREQKLEEKLKKLEVNPSHWKRFEVATSLDAGVTALIEEKSEDEESLQLWGLADSKLLRTLGKGEWKYRNVVFSPDGKVLAAGKYNGEGGIDVSIFDVDSAKFLTTIKPATVDGLRLLVISPDNNKLALGDWYGPVELWDIQSGKLLHTWRID